jgi:AmmeMemoRadiSam system protein B/AmmeMemoRadiSam system protein A
MKNTRQKRIRLWRKKLQFRILNFSLKFFIFHFSFLVFTTGAFAEVKDADLAGAWYPASGKALSAQLESYLNKATPSEISGKLIGVIAPHAGYAYSGPVAAYSFKAVNFKDVKTAVIVGFSHRKRYSGTAVLDAEGFRTPLGVAKIDRAITKALVAHSEKIYPYPKAFEEENSVEMEIPFLQMFSADIKVVLIAIGDQSRENCRALGRALGYVLKNKENVLLIASTDMCHYEPYEQVNEIDAATISVIEEFDPDEFYRRSRAAGHRLLCGYGAVYATMVAAKELGANKIEILKYANSGDTSGNRNSVVGYLSAAFVESEVRSQKSEVRGQRSEVRSQRSEVRRGKDMLNDAEKKKLLKLARDTINHYLKTGKKPEVKENDPVLNEEMGAFVTLHKHGDLRGCIGNIAGEGPLYLTVRDMAIQAAFSDRRFPPVSQREMKDIDIEISALSPLEKIEDPEKIIMGRHGVIVKSGFRSGVYLPQVATETGWTREEFMSSLCAHKAGLPADAWKTGDCEIYIFTAEVFGEKDE